MPTKKDYYEILGVERDADDKAIKSAYRRLARKHHPDVNKGDSSAEEKFKEVAEAFAVLSDAEKRAKYDRGGHEAFGAGFDPFTGFDFQDLNVGGFGNLSDLFGMFGGFGGFGGGQARAPRPRKGENLKRRLRLPFADAVRGTTVELVLPRRVRCGVCNGGGTAPGTGQTVCPECRGSGRTAQAAGGIRMQTACRRCAGAGSLPGQPCGACAGSGRIEREERVKVRIPPGVIEGNHVRLAGKGDAGRSGGPDGDLFLELTIEPDPVFRRDGRNLRCDATIGLARAALGGTLRVPTLDGETGIQLPPGTKSGQNFRLRGEGVPAAGGKPAGDLLVVIQIEPPRKLDDRGRELMEEFGRLHPDEA